MCHLLWAKETEGNLNWKSKIVSLFWGAVYYNFLTIRHDEHVKDWGS